jgi:hypothetical protein
MRLTAVCMVLMVVACLALAGCGNAVSGKWEDQFGQIVVWFQSDGNVTTYSAGSPTGTAPYRVEGSNLTLGPGTFMGSQIPAKTVPFTVSGEALTIDPGGAGALSLQRMKTMK